MPALRPKSPARLGPCLFVIWFERMAGGTLLKDDLSCFRVAGCSRTLAHRLIWAGSVLAGVAPGKYGPRRMRLVGLQIDQNQIHRPIDRNSNHAFALIDPTVLSENLLILRVQFREDFQALFASIFIDSWNVLALHDKQRTTIRRIRGSSPSQ